MILLASVSVFRGVRLAKFLFDDQSRRGIKEFSKSQNQNFSVVLFSKVPPGVKEEGASFMLFVVVDLFVDIIMRYPLIICNPPTCLNMTKIIFGFHATKLLSSMASATSSPPTAAFLGLSLSSFTAPFVSGSGTSSGCDAAGPTNPRRTGRKTSPLKSPNEMTRTKICGGKKVEMFWIAKVIVIIMLLLGQWL